MIGDLVALLAFPCIAAIIFVGMHSWLGLQVLRRNVVFADLALAQLSVLRAGGGGPAAPGANPTLWDFVFYASFGLVVASSVALAGVLLVFSFLIIPAVIGTLFSRRIGVALVIGWAAGVLASLLGFGAS